MKKLIAFICIANCLFTVNAQYKYPATKTVDSSNTYFGVTYKDPYRWLEYIEDTAVGTWFKEQAAYTNSILNSAIIIHSANSKNADMS